MKTFAERRESIPMEMFSEDNHYVLQQIKTKIDDILKLIQRLPQEAKQFTKNLLTERIHDIFLVLDSEQSSVKDTDYDCLNKNAQTHNLSSFNVHDDNGNNSVSIVSGSSDLSGYASYRIGDAGMDMSHMTAVTSLPTNVLSLSGNDQSSGQLSSQYLIHGIQTVVATMDKPRDDQRDDVDNLASGNPDIGMTEMENDEATQQLMDEIDDIKPKSNMPFIKDGTPDTTYTTASEDVSSLLSFLPQLSPYIQLDLRDGSNISEKDGFIHLTVERADGSVQNLKLAAATPNSEDATKLGQEKKVKHSYGDKKLTLIQKHLMSGENNPFRDEEEEPKIPPEVDIPVKFETPKKEKTRGRPRKKQIFHSEILENGQKVFYCSLCHASAQTQYAMEVHMRRHSGEKPFSCELCSKAFTTKGNLKNHMVTHKDDKPFTCTYCQKTFKENRVLLIHQRTHTGERPYKCNICDKSFTQSGVLKEHLLVHSGQKPHLCDLCGQGFRGLSSLRAHKLRHLQKKAFKCLKCDMDFICQADLSRHDMTHTGVRPFMCSLCPKTFTRLNYLKEHLNVHNGVKPFGCTECNAAFPDSISLHRHKRKHKTEKDDLNKVGNQTELQTHLIMGNQSSKLTPNLPGFEIMHPSQVGDQSFHMVLNENASMEDIRKLQLLISPSNNTDINTGQDTSQVAQPVYQVMCMNPDTREIVNPAQNEQVSVEGQTAYLSAINMLANATSQQYSFSIQ